MSLSTAWSHRHRLLPVVGAVFALIALIWLAGLTWNWLSNRNDLSGAEAEGILSTRTFAARCGATQELWSFARRWDYRCEFFARRGASTYAPLSEVSFGVVLVRVDARQITALSNSDLPTLRSV
jgi:hypothetical protein